MDQPMRRGRPGACAAVAAAALLAASAVTATAGDDAGTRPVALPRDVRAAAEAALRADADVLLNAVRQRVADCARAPR